MSATSAAPPKMVDASTQTDSPYVPTVPPSTQVALPPTASLLGISLEIRNVIYGMVFEGAKIDVREYVLGGKQPMPEGGPDEVTIGFSYGDELLWTCRQIYAEARSVYQENVRLEMPLELFHWEQDETHRPGKLLRKAISEGYTVRLFEKNHESIDVRKVSRTRLLFKTAEVSYLNYESWDDYDQDFLQNCFVYNYAGLESDSDSENKMQALVSKHVHLIWCFFEYLDNLYTPTFGFEFVLPLRVSVMGHKPFSAVSALLELAAEV